MLQQVYAQVSTTFTNPLGIPVNNLKDLFTVILNLILAVGFSLVLIMLGAGFIQYILSQGDKTGVEKAQKWVTYAVVGGVGLFLTFVLRTVLQNVLSGNNIANTTGNNVAL